MDMDFMPKMAVIDDIINETEKEKRFKLKFKDGSNFKFRGGQFLILSIMGVGEAPFSITSDSDNKKEFEICVRAVGTVSTELHKKCIGETVGIRGPFGTAFALEKFENSDILFIAGGIGLVPLKPSIIQALANRDKYNSLTLLYGSKTYSEMVYKSFIDELSKSDITVNTILDDAKDTKMRQGLITALVDEYKFSPNTNVFIVGPPIMYKFVIKLLLEKGVKADNIFVSLERHMKCGVGRCGHCRIDDICVCKDGPVFCYSDILEKRGAL